MTIQNLNMMQVWSLISDIYREWLNSFQINKKTSQTLVYLKQVFLFQINKKTSQNISYKMTKWILGISTWLLEAPPSAATNRKMRDISHIAEEIPLWWFMDDDRTQSCFSKGQIESKRQKICCYCSVFTDTQASSRIVVHWISTV